MFVFLFKETCTNPSSFIYLCDTDKCHEKFPQTAKKNIIPFQRYHRFSVSLHSGLKTWSSQTMTSPNYTCGLMLFNFVFLQCLFPVMGIGFPNAESQINLLTWPNYGIGFRVDACHILPFKIWKENHKECKRFRYHSFTKWLLQLICWIWWSTIAITQPWIW